MTTKISRLVNLSMFKNEYSWGTAVKENTTDEFHQKFDTALSEVKNDLGKDYPIIINGKKIHLSEKYEVKSPADTSACITLLTSIKASSLDALSAPAAPINFDGNLLYDFKAPNKA